MVKPEIIDGNLVLHVQGMDKLWALKSQLTIPLKHITGIRMDKEIVNRWWHGFKLPGTDIPRVITAGTFYQHGKRVFWDIHHPEAAVVISLEDESYNELVIEVEDPLTFISEISRLQKQ